MNTFRYNISMTYIYKNKEYTIDSTNIKNLIIDYDYLNRNMPILFITVSMDKNVIDDMIINSKTKTLILTISKYENQASINIRKNYIHGEFIYFTTDELNTTEDLDYSNETKNSKDINRQITLGLMDLNLINNNKKLINDVFMDTYLLDIILKHTSHIKMLIEPVSNIKIDRFIIPPITTISKFIRYVHSYYNLYNTSYRLFYDFDRTYLLSSSGESVIAKGESIHSVIININKSNIEDSKVQGIYIDKISKSYIIETSPADIKYLEDKATDISYNKIIGIDSNGSYKSVEFNLRNSIPQEKIRLERINNDNLNILDNIKSDILNSSMSVHLVKTELDTTLLTLNRKYIIKNKDKYSNIDGTFTLSSKKEIYSPDNGSFILTTMIGLKKVILS